MNFKTLVVVAGVSLALAACALPVERILTQAQAACRAGDRTACRQLPYLIEQVRIAQQDREARTQAALMAVSAGAFAYSAAAASRPVYVVQPSPVIQMPAPIVSTPVPLPAPSISCTTMNLGAGIQTTNCN